MVFLSFSPLYYIRVLQFLFGCIYCFFLICGSGCLQYSFDVGILAIFGQLDANHREQLKENYCIVNKGYNSFPTNVPGTTYKKALLVRKKLENLFYIYIYIYKLCLLYHVYVSYFLFWGTFNRRGKGLSIF